MVSDSIMIIDDDINICELLDIYITSEGYHTTAFQSGAEALKHLRHNHPMLVLLDIMMPEMDGFEVLERIRAISDIPVIMLTARDWPEDMVLGFELGASDYIVKPFEPLEVLARIRARLRERSRQRSETIHINNVSLDIIRNEVMVDNKLLILKRKEIQLLSYMLDHMNIILSREELLERVWNYDDFDVTRTVDMHIKRLRDKLSGANAEICIATIRGAGYKLVSKQ